jgi:hypothetical protein
MCAHDAILLPITTLVTVVDSEGPVQVIDYKPRNMAEMQAALDHSHECIGQPAEVYSGAAVSVAEVVALHYGTEVK